MKSWRRLELQIEEALDNINRYCQNALGVRLEVRQARKDGKFVYCKRQPFDYEIILPAGLPSWFFDVKECSGERWYASKSSKTAHQKAALLKMQKMGHRAGFLVYFKSCLALRFVEDWSRPATPESGVVFVWQEFCKRG